VPIGYTPDSAQDAASPASSRRHDGDAEHAPAIDLEREASLEDCGALRRFWYVGCTSATLTTTKPVSATILGVPLAIFRDERGSARAVTDRCLHRAAALSAGVVVDGKLCCPYHGWTYDGGGACVHIPSLGPSQRGTRLSDADHGRSGLRLAPSDVGCLETWPTLEQDGLVYVYLGGDPNTALRPPFRVPYADDPAWCVYFMVTDFENGVTNLVENFMDVPHTVFVHQGWFRNPSQKRVPATVERTDGSVLVTYQQESDRISGLGFVLNPQGLPMTHTDKFYIPNITRVDYLFGEVTAPKSGFIINSQCTPAGPMSSRVYTAISYRLPVGPFSKPVSKLLEPIIHWYTRQVITQDTEVMEIQKAGLTRGAREVRFTSTEADLLHKDIECYRRWLLDGGHVDDAPDDQCRDIEFWI
jgi:phenylpropionate dioxygenase-like ring-hydroxylating dioxygenase large terminal subunit